MGLRLPRQRDSWCELLLVASVVLSRIQDTLYIWTLAVRTARLQCPVKTMSGVGVTDLDLQVARLDKIYDEIGEFATRALQTMA